MPNDMAERTDDGAAIGISEEADLELDTLADAIGQRRFEEDSAGADVDRPGGIPGGCIDAPHLDGPADIEATSARGKLCLRHHAGYKQDSG